MFVAIQKSFLLEEIAEHQAVQHERGVMGRDVQVADSRDEFLETILVLPEVIVKPPGEAVTVEIVMQAMDDAGDVEGFLLIEGEGDGNDLLNEKFVGTALFPSEFPAADGFPREAGGPKPDLTGLRLIDKDQEVLCREWGDRRFESLPLIGGHDGTIGAGWDKEDFDAAFFRDDLEIDNRPRGGNPEFGPGRRPVPTDGGIREQARKIKGLEVAGGFLALLRRHRK